MAPVRVHVEVEGDGEHGEEQDKQNPGDFNVGVLRPVDHDQGHDEAQEHGPAVDGVVPHPVEARKEEGELSGQQEDHDGSPSEDQAEEASFTLVEQEDGLLVQGLSFFCHGGYSLFFLYHSTCSI